MACDWLTVSWIRCQCPKVTITLGTYVLYRGGMYMFMCKCIRVILCMWCASICRVCVCPFPFVCKTFLFLWAFILWVQLYCAQIRFIVLLIILVIVGLIAVLCETKPSCVVYLICMLCDHLTDNSKALIGVITRDRSQRYTSPGFLCVEFPASHSRHRKPGTETVDPTPSVKDTCTSSIRLSTFCIWPSSVSMRKVSKGDILGLVGVKGEGGVCQSKGGGWCLVFKGGSWLSRGANAPQPPTV